MLFLETHPNNKLKQETLNLFFFFSYYSSHVIRKPRRRRKNMDLTHSFFAGITGEREYFISQRSHAAFFFLPL